MRLLVDGGEDLFEPRYVPFGLCFVLGESSFEVKRLRRLLHLGKRGENLLFRKVDVLQRVVEQFVEFFEFSLCAVSSN